MANILQNKLIEGVEKSVKMYIQDLEALTDEQLHSSPGGQARKPIDFSYEVAAVNDRVAKRLHQQDPGPWPFDGWATAPESHHSKAAITGYLQETANTIISGLKKYDDEALANVFQIDGNETSYADMANLVIYHMGYHDGQLNYAQSLHGDAEVHWK